MVFDSLTPEALSLAQTAALAEMPMNGESPGRLGVFATEPGLRMLQPYTERPRARALGVRRVTAAGTSAKTRSGAARADQRPARQLDALGRRRHRPPAAFGPGNDNSSTAQAIVEEQMANMEMRMIRNFESIDRDHRGFGTASALMSIIQSLTMWPGRKTIVYFSEGLPASPAMQAKLDSVVSAANRANVSVYAIDAAGLRSESTLIETRREIDMAAEERLRQSGTSRDAQPGPLTRIVERTEDLLRLDPQGASRAWRKTPAASWCATPTTWGRPSGGSTKTTGFTTCSTYSPKNEQFDGKFRTIDVKVRRDGAQVFSRKGYFAVRSAVAPVLSYEAPAIAALDSGKPPNAFAIGAAAMVFPEPSGKTLVPIVVQVRTNQLRSRSNKEKGTYTAQAAMVARIKDSRGETVLTLSQQYILTGTDKELDAAREARSSSIARLTCHLASTGSRPSSTTPWPNAAARGFRPSTCRPFHAAGLTASSLVLVRRSEQVPSAERAPNLPFYYGDQPAVPERGRATAARHGRGADVLHRVLSRRGETTSGRRWRS